MAAEQFSLCWNNFHTNLSSGFHSLLQAEHLVDVTLAAEGKYFKAHKMVLSVCSPYFSELFRVNPCKHPIVILKDVGAGIMNQLLQFMYRGEVSVRQDELGSFIKTAESLQIKGLTGQSSSSPAHSTDSQPNGISNAFSDDVRNLYNKMDSNSTSTKKRQRAKLPVPKLKSIERSKTSPLSINVIDNTDNKDDFLEGVAAKRKCTSLSTASIDDDPIGLPVETQFLEPKREPPDELDEYHDTDHASIDDSLDASALLDAKMTHGEFLTSGSGNALASTSGTSNWLPQKLKPLQKGEQPTPGNLRFLTSGKGLPVLVYNGHMYVLEDRKVNKTTWVCVKKNKLNCKGCVTTSTPGPCVTGNLSSEEGPASAENSNSSLKLSATAPKIISYSGHNHSQLSDIIDRIQAKDSICVTPKA